MDAARNRFVHESCVQVHARLVQAAARARAVEDADTLPHGLKPSTLRTYSREWERYLAFVHRHGRDDEPGNEGPWDVLLLWHYLQYRATTCKPTSLRGVLSALGHFGGHRGQLLATSRFDSDSVMYRRICDMKNQLFIAYRARTGGDATALGPNRCTPLGCRAVSLLFNSFAVVDKASFGALSRSDRHHLVGCVMQHSCAMRFGHFPARAYVRDMFASDPDDGSFRLVTDWHRYSGRRKYCLSFQTAPRYRSRMYTLRDARGNDVDSVSAATVLAWHFYFLERDDEQTVFAPEVDALPSRANRQAWLRAALLAALPTRDARARAMVADVTPHSFRPGLAGDLLREGMLPQAIAVECRWSDIRNVRLYGERLPLCAARRSLAFRLNARHA